MESNRRVESPSPIVDALSDYQSTGATLEDERKEWERRADHNKRLFELEEEDITWRIKQRPKILRYFKLLLIGQNFFVAALLSYALWKGKMTELQIIFSVLVAGTLTTTTITIRIIVNFLFKNISYRYQKPENKR